MIEAPQAPPAAPDVDALMSGGLSDWLAQQQGVRDAAIATSRKRTMQSLIAAAVLGLLTLVVAQQIGWAFFVGAGIAGLGQAWAYAARKPVIDAIKQEMNNRIAATLGLAFTNAAVPGAEFETAKTFELLPGHDTKSFEDDWAGPLGGVPFRLYETHLQEWRGSGKNRHLETVFQGVIMTVRFARNFLGTTLVERAGSHSTFFGMRDSLDLGGVKLEQIDMVDTRFERDFTVWGSDGVEARYLVHPAYVERLLDIEQRFHGKKIRALFHGGDLIIALEADAMFESGSLYAAQDRERMAETIGQFMALATLAREMNERPRGAVG